MTSLKLNAQSKQESLEEDGAVNKPEIGRFSSSGAAVVGEL